MGIIANAKEVADLVKNLGNTELYRKIVELEGEIIELTRQNRQLEEKVQDQQRLLDLKGKMKWEKPVYRMEGEDDPYCQQCWEASQKTIHLTKSRGIWYCLNCDKLFE